MSDQQTSDQEKIALYLDHVDAITDVTAAFESEWTDYTTRWGQDMQAALDHDSVTPGSPTNEDYTDVTVDRGANDDERWIFYDNGGDWQHAFKYGWRRREQEDEILVHRASDRNDLRIGFYHRMGDDSNRDTAVQDRELRFNFRCMGSNPTAFRDTYNEEFDKRIRSIEDCLESTNAATTGEKLTMIRGTYPIRVNEHDGFFEAYTAALNDAFVELAVENPGLVRILSEAFEDSIEACR